MVRIDTVDEVDPGTLTEDDARRAGVRSLEELQRLLGRRDGAHVYRTGSFYWPWGTRSHTVGGRTSADASGRIGGVNPSTVATAFRIVAVAEALSWIGLLIGMFVKYVPGTSELGVQIFGPIHGGVFVAYVVVALLAARVLRWSLGTTFLALLASIPPLMTIWFERRATRTGRLPRSEAVAA